jgi:hypothetical protein
MDKTLIQTICGIGAVILFVLFLMRRRKRRMSGK